MSETMASYFLDTVSDGVRNRPFLDMPKCASLVFRVEAAEKPAAVTNPNPDEDDEAGEGR